MFESEPNVFKGVYSEVEPWIQGFHPIWWHHHGIKLNKDESLTPHCISIRSKAASLEITRADSSLRLWVARWAIKHGGCAGVSGSTEMDLDALRSAFDLGRLTTSYSKYLIDRYGATTAEQGVFIRYQRFLNIPGPGTGHDGDPNLSLEVNPELSIAVRSFIQTTI